MPITSVSVVIPAYNSAPWLESTIVSIDTAAQRASFPVDICIVDDGSIDETAQVIDDLSRVIRTSVNLIQQQNKGRFLAVWEGVNRVSSDWVLILNSRQLLSPNFFEVFEQHAIERTDLNAWCSHVDTEPNSPLIGHFWTVPTAVFWGVYWRNLQQTEITLENFDKVPKGTGGLIVRTSLMKEACLAIWPHENAEFISDDTKLLRFIASENPICLDPEIKSTYRPRVKFSSFLSHSFGRGTMFIDSYAGTSLLRNIILLMLVFVPLVTIIALLLLLVPTVGFIPLGAALAVFYSLVVVMSLLGMKNHASPKSALSFIVYSLPFSLVFWAGLLRGAWIHRRNFFHVSREVSS